MPRVWAQKWACLIHLKRSWGGYPSRFGVPAAWLWIQGIHSKGWSKAKAVAFMKANTLLSDAMIETEVNRYIAWPGQALAYKIGELKIRALRALAIKTLGSKFDLAEFHDVVLGQGAVPLDVLEAQVKDWIAAEQSG